MHFPQSEEEIEKARYRLIYEEFFLLQLWLNSVKNENKAKNTTPFKKNEDSLVQKFINSLPFELTNGQKSALSEIENDLNSTSPMQRLLQGDVGSGKTIVALLALVDVVGAGFQGALMAPTEVLAMQHYESFTEIIKANNLDINCVLLTGSLTASEKRRVHEDIANHKADIVIGTHAVITDKVEFNKCICGK